MDVVDFGVTFGCDTALLFGFRLLLRLWVCCFGIDCFGVGWFGWWFGFYCVGVGFGWRICVVCVGLLFVMNTCCLYYFCGVVGCACCVLIWFWVCCLFDLVLGLLLVGCFGIGGVCVFWVGFAVGC